MSVTIQINGRLTHNSLVHKGSGGIARSTLPDVCKTPSPGGPIPVPYPVIVSTSSDLSDGTTTVGADGGNSIAVKGSQLRRCTGDEPGTAGGVKSGTFLKEARWILYSFDVLIEGRNACRLADKLTMNHANTACLAGFLQGPVVPQSLALGVYAELKYLCDLMCQQRALGDARQTSIASTLKAADRALMGGSPLKAEVPFDRQTLEPYMSRNEPWRATGRRPSGSAIPDVVITDGGPPIPGNIRAVVEMKFATDGSGAANFPDYEAIAGRSKFIVLKEGRDCICEDDLKPQPEPVPVPVPEKSSFWADLGAAAGWAAVTVVAAAATVVAVAIPFDGPAGEYAGGVATAGAATRFAAAFSRLFKFGY